MTEETAEDWFELGKYHSSLNNSRNAINCYEKCVAEDPNHYKAWSNLAAEYFQQKSYERSIECCKEAIKINENDKNSWLTLAANYFQTNEDGRARFCFQKADELDNLKARRFLEKVKRANDKILDAPIIDVYSEIFKEELVRVKDHTIGEEVHEKDLQTSQLPDPKDKDYYEKLIGFLIELGNKFIIEMGGVISIIELYSYIKSTYPAFRGKPNHILKALKEMEKNKIIEGVKQLKDRNISIIEFVPSELTTDVKTILDMATKSDYLDYDDILNATLWDNYRIKRVMKFLEHRNIAKKSKSFLEGKKWFFPSLE